MSDSFQFGNVPNQYREGPNFVSYGCFHGTIESGGSDICIKSCHLRFNFEYAMAFRRRGKSKRPSRRRFRRGKRQGHVTVSRDNKPMGYIRRTRGRAMHVSKRLLTAIKFTSMIWKATRTFADTFNVLAGGAWTNLNSNNGIILSMIDNPAFVGTAANCIGIPKFDRASALPQAADPKQSRQGADIFLKSIKGCIALQSTTNKAMSVRLICFQLSGKAPAALIYDPGYLGVADVNYPVLDPVLGTSNYLFEDFIFKADETLSDQAANAFQLVTVKFNQDLVKSRRDIFMDKVIDIRSHVILAGGADDASSDTFMKISIDIPLNRWATYEEKDDASVLGICNQGPILFCVLPGLTDPTNAANAGGLRCSYKLSVVFKDNA